MNCPAKTEPIVGDGHNQNPNALCSDLTTRSDLGRVANARLQREHLLSDPKQPCDNEIIPAPPSTSEEQHDGERGGEHGEDYGAGLRTEEQEKKELESSSGAEHNAGREGRPQGPWKKGSSKVLNVLRTYLKFVGPGFMVSVVSHKRQILYYRGIELTLNVD